MKKVYIPPEAEIEKFNIVCVITTSLTDPSNHGVGDEGDNEF